MKSLRQLLLDRLPPWLTGDVAGRLLYAIGVNHDALFDWALEGFRVRLPSKQAGGNLLQVGSDRGLPKYASETEGAYKRRITRWMATLRRKGHPFALLEQLHGYLYHQAVDVTMWQQGSSVAYRIKADGTQEIFAREVFDWDGGDVGRYWVGIVKSSIVALHDDLTWAPTCFELPESYGTTNTYGDGTGYGGVDPTAASDLRKLCIAWQPTHAKLGGIIFCPYLNMFLPDTDGNPNTFPNGTWGSWSTGGQPNRSPNAYYVDGEP
jgi:hypothetical protein